MKTATEGSHDGMRTSAAVFVGVKPSRPLSPGEASSQISIIRGPASFAAGGVFDMAIDGQFQGGRHFGCNDQTALVGP